MNIINKNLMWFGLLIGLTACQSSGTGTSVMYGEVKAGLEVSR